MTLFRSVIAIPTTLWFAFGYVGHSQAAAVVGGSGLLTPADANQLETWLGEGPITLTSVFSKTTDGADASIFHALADGQGRTFTVFEVTDSSNGSTSVIGGYNPVSWQASLGNYVYNTTDLGRTAFIFNLTLGMRQDQILGNSNGAFQTFNASNYGPSFGGGDLFTTPGTSLGAGGVFGFSYGDGVTNILGHTGSTATTYARIDVFSIGVPEPARAALTALGILGLFFLRHMRERSARD